MDKYFKELDSNNNVIGVCYIKSPKQYMSTEIEEYLYKCKKKEINAIEINEPEYNKLVLEREDKIWKQQS